MAAALQGELSRTEQNLCPSRARCNCCLWGGGVTERCILRRNKAATLPELNIFANYAFVFRKVGKHQAIELANLNFSGQAVGCAPFRQFSHRCYITKARLLIDCQRNTVADD